MSERDDGGPAFPRHEQEESGRELIHRYYHGMTLRDYFAAAALSAGWVADTRGTRTPAAAAASAYAHADAMLAERAK